MPLHLVHLDPGVAVVHVADVQIDQIQKLLALRLQEIRGARPCVVEHHVVLERLGQVVVLGLVGVEDRLLALRVVQRQQHVEPRFCSS